MEPYSVGEKEMKKKQYDLEKQEAIVEILWTLLGDHQNFDNSDHDAKQCRDDGATITANLQAMGKALTGILEIFGLSEVEVQ
jgi:hypothetical protein